jgi:hypothetical protein
MTAKHGSKATVLLGSADISTYFTDLSFSADVDTADTTTFGSTWKSAIPGAVTSKVTLKGLYDPTFTALPATLADGGDVLTIGPAGLLAVGDQARLILVGTTSYVESSPVGGVVGADWSALAFGSVGAGYLLHVAGADTDTTTGADKDDGSASATGWTAHLHVMGVTGGSWVVKLQDAATTDWADVTGAAFSAATNATSQRLNSAGRTTALRRHVRYVATRTGGSASDSLTFALAYARNT